MKALITEDHDIYRDGLRHLIESMYSDVNILEAANYRTTVDYLTIHRDMDFLLLDIKIPGVQGLEGLEALRKLFPNLTIIVISTLDFGESVNQMISLGANGFIAKTTPKDQMIKAINNILAGELTTISEHNLDEMVKLSKRQIDTLLLLEKGRSNKDIANELGVSYATAREHVSNLLKRLKAENRTQAVQRAKEIGLIF